jgi:signal transduction histidine kinase
VLGNRDAITRIVVNLLDNAVKYGPPGQTVRVGIDRVDGAARLTVSDQGPGVPPGDREQVWKPYRRLERDVKARLPGTGIGLSVVAELASLHEGRAWVEDAKGGGAEFVVELPLAPAEASPIDATPAPKMRVPAGGRA